MNGLLQKTSSVIPIEQLWLSGESPIDSTSSAHQLDREGSLAAEIEGFTPDSSRNGLRRRRGPWYLVHGNTDFLANSKKQRRSKPSRSSIARHGSAATATASCSSGRRMRKPSAPARSQSAPRPSALPWSKA